MPPTRPSARPHLRATAVLPKLLCASCQRSGVNGQYCARSTRIGCVDSTAVATAALASEGSSAAMFSVMRLPAGTVFVLVTGAPPSGRNVTVALASDVPGFASSTNVVKKEPVAPSARNQRVEGSFTPADSCPALNTGVPKYIARSAAPGCANVTAMPNDRLTSSGIELAPIVRRDVGASVNVVTTGAPFSTRNVTVAVFSVGCGFASSTYVSKKPCAPSAKSHVVAGPSVAFSVCDSVARRIPAHRPLDGERKRRGRRDGRGELGALEAGESRPPEWSCATSAPASATAAPRRHRL